jgi:ubiquinone/menaquinone biosynthesis C-methylase UbiE
VKQPNKPPRGIKNPCFLKKLLQVLAKGKNLPFADNSFNYIVFRLMVWNLEQMEEAYKAWLRILKPSGRILVMGDKAGDAEYAQKGFTLIYVAIDNAADTIASELKIREYHFRCFTRQQSKGA